MELHFRNVLRGELDDIVEVPADLVEHSGHWDLDVAKLLQTGLHLAHLVTTIFTLPEQKILQITGSTHIRLEILGSVKFSAVNQQTPKEREVRSEKFTGELIPNVPTVVAYHC